MSKILKRRYKQSRIEFKSELLERCEDNKALAMLLLETYVAWHHMRHIGKIWAMFRNPDYREFQMDYSKNLFGKHLSGRSDIWHSLYFADRGLYDKYARKIPECYAMGDALGIAYRVLRKGDRE
ncbi:hypothetical protein DMN77_08165 [Paenibacillus sp. 79R4]|uniref:hypothetical protein n=1 Tax=Paenibacillus sp. 79R4 TaxID=2212847 RepID=UPI0015BF4B46|nr:hypothetical protein [Paenibacillus sp. 79R4]NWL87578.1 hypothetical protein [Paenibacillus sp. 79R4]